MFKKAECRVDEGSMYLWMEKIYRINEEVEEGNKKTLKRENNKNCGGGNKYVGNKKN